MKSSVYTTRLLKGLVALAAVCVVAQSYAANEYEETFEGYTNGSLATNVSELAWTALGSDASVVTNIGPYAYSAPTLPLSQTYGTIDHLNVLKLDTQGDELTNSVSTAANSGTVYIDQMVYLVPSDENPNSITNDPTIQAAVFLNSSSNLVVMHGGPNGTENTFSAFPTVIPPETWVRLTITMDYDSQDATTPFVVEADWFQVAVDGIVLTNATDGFSAPIGEGGTPGGGSWFLCANKGNGVVDEDNLAGISYMGTGMIDDLVVTTTTPDIFGGGTPTGFFTVLTVVAGNGTVDPGTNVTVAVGESTQLVYNAENYYEIAELVESGITNVAAAGLTSYTNTYSAAGTNEVTFGVHLSPVSGAPATWYGPIGLGDGDDYGTGDPGDYTLMQAYVAGIMPTDTYEITDFSIDGSGILTITWEGVDSPAPKDPSKSVSVMGSDTVGGATTEYTGAATFDGTTTWTWTSDGAVTSKFLYLSAN